MVITGPKLLIKANLAAPIFLIASEINNKGKKVQNMAITIIITQDFRVNSVVDSGS